MKKNEANLDRIIRIVMGLGILSLTVIGPQTLFGLIGIVPIITGLMGWCPMYSLFGIGTCPLHQNKIKITLQSKDLKKTKGDKNEK